MSVHYLTPQRHGHSRYYFVTGLPRSGTAWMANLLTWGESICLHEAARNGRLLPQLELLPCYYAGTGDSGLGFLREELERDFPGARLLVIHREPAEAAGSLAQAFPDLTNRQVLGLIANTVEVLGDLSGTTILSTLHMDFSELWEERTTKVAWEFLLPEVPFPRWRYQELRGMRVEVLPQVRYPRGQKVRPNWSPA